MIKSLAILGSTGSIGSSTLSSIQGNKNYKVKLISTNSNIKKAFQQAIKFKIKDVIIEDKNKYEIYKNKFKKKKINLHLGVKNINKILKKKITFCVNSITGIDGLEPTIKIIPFTKFILIANKESIICGWNLISKKLKKYKTNFIPIDSEHYSIWELIKNEKYVNIKKIILTASGGPFLNISKKKIKNIKPKLAIKHPNWKMGKKISIDSSTMMNKIFEYIEAIKIFNLDRQKLSILIHPSSFIHAIVFFRGQIIKFLAHKPDMVIPISNALGIKRNFSVKLNAGVSDLNNLKFESPDLKKFPLLSILKLIPNRNSYFETILITINDNLVNKYLNGRINYISIQRNILILIKRPYFVKYYKLKPKSIYDINKMIVLTNKYLESNIKNYEN
tara:strand:- start:215 stop:1384 length:1170 start_codon:yes stop_codon:yes gene_type:complete